MLNAIGLANPGRERFLAEHLPRLRELGLPLWVSVGGFCADDYAETCAALDGRRGDRAQPLVPERRRGGRLGGRDRRRLPRARRRCRSTRSSPPRIRTSRRSRARSPPPAPTGSRSSTRCAASRSIRARCGRCSRAAAAASRARRSSRSRSHAVHALPRGDGLPIVGMGGIPTGRDALEFVACGARDVALGTVLFADPGRAGARPRRARRGVRGRRCCQPATQRVWQKARKPSEKSPLDRARARW